MCDLPNGRDSRLTYCSARHSGRHGGGPTAVSIRRTRPGAYSCSYEEGKFFYTPGLALLGLPATPSGGCGGQTAVGIEWFGAAHIGNLLPWVAGGPSRSGGERVAAYDCRPPPPRSSSRSDSDRQPYARAAGHVSHGTNEWDDSRRATTALPTSGHRQPLLGHSSQTPSSALTSIMSALWRCVRFVDR